MNKPTFPPDDIEPPAAQKSRPCCFCPFRSPIPSSASCVTHLPHTTRHPSEPARAKFKEGAGVSIIVFPAARPAAWYTHACVGRHFRFFFGRGRSRCATKHPPCTKDAGWPNEKRKTPVCKTQDSVRERRGSGRARVQNAGTRGFLISWPDTPDRDATLVQPTASAKIKIKGAFDIDHGMGNWSTRPDGF